MITNIQERCDDLTDLYGLEPHTVVYEGRLGTGGYVVLEERWIVISPHMDEAHIDDTLRHELAHAKVWKDSSQTVATHGPAWQEAARLLGAIPVACSAPDTPWLQRRRAAQRRKAS